MFASSYKYTIEIEKKKFFISSVFLWILQNSQEHLFKEFPGQLLLDFSPKITFPIELKVWCGL